MELLRTLKPQWWFAAHLHTRFEACVQHEDEDAANRNAANTSANPFPPRNSGKGENPEEIAIDDELMGELPGVKKSEAIHFESNNEAVGGTARDPNEILIDDDELVVPPISAEAPKSTEERHAAAESRSSLSGQALNPDEITLSDLEDEIAPPPSAKGKTRPVGSRTTKFLALDKCLPRRQFLEVRLFSCPSVFNDVTNFIQGYGCPHTAGLRFST